MGKVIDLGGRYFAPATTTTARQDGWFVAQCSDAGALDLIGGTPDGRKVLDFVMQLFRTGKRELILAGILVEAGAAWTPETAAENAEYFANLTDPAAKAALSDLLIPALTDFFPRALLSSVGSLSASTPAATPAAVAPKPRAKRSTVAARVAAGAV